jgi:protein phosphatase
MQSMLARLKGMMSSLMPSGESDAPAEPKDMAETDGTGGAAEPVRSVESEATSEPAAAAEELAPTFDTPLATPAPADNSPPVAPPTGADDIPVAIAVTEPSAPTTVNYAETTNIPVAEVVEEQAIPAADLAEPPVAEPAVPVGPVPFPCPICGSLRQGESPSCHDCGYYFTKADLARAVASADPPPAAVRLQGRFELGELINERGGVRRYHGVDHGDGAGPAVAVVILEQEVTAADEAPMAEPVEASADGEDALVPTFDEQLLATSPVTEILPSRPSWPSIAWERWLLQTLESPGLPGIVTFFTEGGKEYLMEEVPAGRSLWDAWDDPMSDSPVRFGWLVEVAETLHGLHQCNAMLEGIRPPLIVIGDDGHARINDLADLLPIPVPADAAVRGTMYTAPEIVSGSGQADARAELYAFGGMLYALHVGRELSESDFDRPGHPKPFLPRFPDIHPAFGRLITKTFRREVAARFPTDEASKEDATGFLELIRTLNVLGRTLDNVRLEIACWTTTGIVRTGNEDAFAILHACETRQDDCADSALLLLCDGMGGYEAGEVAAALTIQLLRQNLVQQPMFAHLGGASAFPHDALTPVVQSLGHLGPPLDIDKARQAIKAALREANRTVFTTSRAPGSKRRGMGCTAEVVYVDGRNVVVGHVGDSRTYHLHEGRLIQLTRDQTLVNRLVELGKLSAEEAETHPRRNELQQAIGGQPDVEPGLYHGEMKPGDWVLVCSDGLTNHVNATDLKIMLQSEAQSAEMAARRLVNLVNIEGATDNATVVVIRAT